MNNWAVRALRAVIALALVGSLGVQVVAVGLLWWDTERAPDAIGISLTVIVVLGVVCLQVIGVCVWRLLTMVRRGTVFSLDSFRYVNGVIAALSVGSVLVFAIAVVARFANHRTPGD